MKGLIKACSGGLAIWRRWRGIGLLRIYVGVCAGSCLVGRVWKRWVDTVKECLKKRGLDVRQARRMMQNRCEWEGFVRENAQDVSPGMNP